MAVVHVTTWAQYECDCGMHTGLGAKRRTLSDAFIDAQKHEPVASLDRASSFGRPHRDDVAHGVDYTIRKIIILDMTAQSELIAKAADLVLSVEMTRAQIKRFYR